MNRDLTPTPDRGGNDPYGLELATDRPMTLLVINCGSSSLKFTLFDTMDIGFSAKGQVERIGLPGTRLTLNSSKGDTALTLDDSSHQAAFAAMLDSLETAGGVRRLADITAVAHRGTLGGETYRGAVRVTDEVLEVMKRYIPLFPVHNPPIINGIRLAQDLLPDAVHFTVFDSSFHSTIPSFAYVYALPYEYYEDKGLRRFGYHGSSHQYASLKAAQFFNRPAETIKTIACHLGNGSSICAIDQGRSVDTTLGFSPLDGLIMGTRCGELDPGLVLYLMKEERMGHGELSELFNKKSGLFGLSGISSDMRDIEAAAGDGNQRALLTMKAYIYRVKKYIGAYYATLEGLDILVFTGGIGQGSVQVRSKVCHGLSHMGIVLNDKKNREVDGVNNITDIAASNSPVRVLVIPADEERMIARETLSALEADV